MSTKKEDFPLKRCQRDGSKGWKWGDNGYCYTKKEEGTDEAAKEKARKQGRAIKRKQKNDAFSLLQERDRIIKHDIKIKEKTSSSF